MHKTMKPAMPDSSSATYTSRVESSITCMHASYPRPSVIHGSDSAMSRAHCSASRAPPSRRILINSTDGLCGRVPLRGANHRADQGDIRGGLSLDKARIPGLSETRDEQAQMDSAWQETRRPGS